MVKLPKFPEVGELVVGTVLQVKGFGAFVKLEEYDNKEGFIHITEVTTGWVKYIRDYVKEKQRVVCKVMRINKEKSLIDLSIKHVSKHQKIEKIQEWKNEQKAERLFDILKEEGFEGDWIEAFVNIAKENIPPPYVDVNGVLDLTSNSPIGIEHIKKALIKAEEIEDVDIQYIGAPKYRIHAIALDYKTANESIKKAVNIAIDYIKEHDGEGSFKVI